MVMHRLLFLIPVAVFAVVVVYFGLGLQRDPSIVPSALIDKPAPEFDLPPVLESGEGFKTADLEGRVSLVNVFASWCIPCRVEHPFLMKLAKEGTVPILGINWKDKQPDAVAWLQELGDPFERIGADLSGRTGIDWGVYGVPETYVIDREGRIRYKHVGPLSPQALDETVLPLIRDLSR